MALQINKIIHKMLPFIPEIECNKTEIPESIYFLASIDVNTFWAMIVGCGCTTFTMVTFAVQVYNINRYVTIPRQRQILRWLSAALPVISMCSMIGVVVPRTWVVVDSFILIYFARILYLYSSLLRTFGGGKKDMAVRFSGEHVRLQSPPCCCCCCCCTKFPPTKRHMETLSLMVLIGSCLVTTMSLLRLIMYMNNPDYAYYAAIKFIINIPTQLSLLIALYATFILNRLVRSPLRLYRTESTFRLLMLTMVTTQFPEGVTDVMATFGVIHCHPLLYPTVRASIYNHLLMTGMCVFLSLVSSCVLRPSIHAAFDNHPSHRRHQVRSKEDTLLFQVNERFIVNADHQI